MNTPTLQVLPSPKPDPAEIKRSLDILVVPGSVVELRAIAGSGRRIAAGYFRDLAALVAKATRLSGEGYAVHVTLNPVNPALFARAADRTVEALGHATGDADIARRTRLLVDSDPVRPSGVSASEDEHQAALARCRETQSWLDAMGWPVPIVADSGNGAHLVYGLDLANDGKSASLLKACLEALAFRFSDDLVVIDTTVYNAARILKVYGTPARKGDSIPERPHRLSRMLDSPTALAEVPVEQLEKLAAMVPRPPRKDVKRASLKFDLQDWIERAGLPIAKCGPWNGGQRWILQSCPFDPQHTDRSAYIVELANGAISAGCQHNGCRDRGWSDLRRLVGLDDNIVGSETAATTPSFRLTLLRDLLAEPQEAVDWLWDQVLPVGGISILAAKPKVGKSTLARNLALAVARGTPFLGRSCLKGVVVYLALEEKRSEVIKHFARMGAEAEEIKVHVGSAPRDAIPELAELIEREKPAMVIIDPIVKLVRIADVNAYAEVSRALEPLISLARKTGSHLLLVHHMGKGERFGGEGFLGSTAFFGAVDAGITMRKRDGLRVIVSEQRYGTDIPETVVALNPETGLVSDGGDYATQRLEQQWEAISAVIREGPATEGELRERVGGNESELGKALRKFVREGRLARTGGGKKNDPFRYGRPVPA